MSKLYHIRPNFYSRLYIVLFIGPDSHVRYGLTDFAHVEITSERMAWCACVPHQLRYPPPPAMPSIPSLFGRMTRDNNNHRRSKRQAYPGLTGPIHFPPNQVLIKGLFTLRMPSIHKAKKPTLFYILFDSFLNRPLVY